VRVDARTGWLIAMSSIDNLIKGAAGQASKPGTSRVVATRLSGAPMTGVTP